MLFLLCTVGISAMAEVVSGTVYDTQSIQSLPEGWTGTDGGGTGFLKMFSESFIQTDNFSIGELTSITIKARKFGGPSEAQAKISVFWVDSQTNTATEVGTITPTSTTLTNYTISSPVSPTNSNTGHIKIACLGAGVDKGSGISQVTISYTESGALAKVSTPYFNLAEGTYTGAQTIEITTSTTGATKVYTLDGSDPTKTSTVYSGPITISKTTTIKAMAIKSGMDNSEIATATYQIVNGKVAVYTVESTSIVTTSGNIPEGASETYSSTYANKCQLTNGNSMTLTLSGYEGCKIKNITLSMRSNKSNGAGTFSAKAGTTTLAEIAEGTNFNQWFKNTAWSTEFIDVPVTMGNDNYVVKNGENIVITIAATVNSIFCQSFTIEYEEAGGPVTQKVATPTFSVAEGTYNSTQNVEIESTTPGASIYYTTNGEQPTTNDNLYFEPIAVSSTTTLKAIAIKSGMTNSEVATAIYTIKQQNEYATTYTSNITLSPDGGTNAQNNSVAIKGETYSALKAGTSQNAGAVQITIPAGTTTLHLHAAAWNKETVKLGIEGATCTPNEYSLTYDSGITGNGGPFTINSTEKAPTSYYFQIELSNITKETTLTISATSGKRFIIWGVNAIGSTGEEKVATPVITPESGVYNSAQTVSISTTTTGAAIYYTTDGSTPNKNSSNLYSGEFTVSSTATIKAIAYKQGMTDSEMASATITIQSGEQPDGTYFDFHTSQPEGWPSTANTSAAGEYTYTLNNVAYKFNLSKKDGTNGIYAGGTANAGYYLMVTNGNSIGLPAIQGKKLASIKIGNSSGCSQSTSVRISYAAGGEAISGGEAQTWETKGSYYTYNLSDADDNTSYYIVVSDANAQITSIELTYVDGDGKQRVATPTFTPESGTYSSTQSIKIQSATSGASIYYTKDGSTPVPNATNTTKYNGVPFSISTNQTIKAIAKKDGMKDSYMSSATYKFAKEYASLSELVAAGEPTTEGETVKVTLTNEVIASLYTSGSYTNGVKINVGNKQILIYCKNVPAEWQVGGLISGTLECPWKLYVTEWELTPSSWSALTYTPVGAHNITIDSNIQNGTVSANYTSASQGTMILLTVTPNEGYQLVKNSLKATTVGGTEVDVASKAFVMPGDDVIVTAQFEAKATSEYDETYDFTKINDFNEWGNKYSEHTVEYPTATVTFEAASKQQQTITDCPVTKDKSVTLKMKDDKTISKIKFVFKQWATKTQTASLFYSTDGGTTYSETAYAESSEFLIETELPEGTDAVKITFSSSSNQIGIESASINYATTSDVKTANMKIGAAKWATFYSAFDVDVPANVYAYIVTLDANENAKRVKLGGDTKYTLPGETPVLIYSDTEGGIDINFEEGASKGKPVAIPNTKNYLIGTEYLLDPLSTTTEGCTNYILQKKTGEENANWYRVVEDKNRLAANRAYLSVPSTANIKELLSLDDDTSIFSATNEAKSVKGIYNIAGQKVQSSYKGIVISNGKKFINK